MGFIYPNLRSLLLLLLLPFFDILATSCKASPISPGAWEHYIQAYSTHKFHPLKTFYTEGIVDIDTGQHKPNVTIILRGQGALATFEFAQNITGRLHLETDSTLTSKNQSIGISFSTSPRRSNSTRLLPLLNGTITEDIRDIFKYVTFFVPPPYPSVSQNRTATIALRDIWVVSMDDVESEEKVIVKEKIGGDLEVVLKGVEVIQKEERIKKAKNSLLAGILKILGDSWGG